MGDTVKKYYEDLEDEEIFSSALAHQQYKKNMSDREIMDSKHPPTAVRVFEHEYP